MEIDLQNKVNEWWDNLSDDRQWYLILNTIGKNIRYLGDLPFDYQLLLFYKYSKDDKKNYE